MISAFALLIVGLTILIISGDFLVRGAVGIAARYNVSKLVIGMTIVAFGTSAPEMIVSLKAALAGHSEIAVGNVIGSNIANIGLVLGCTALILPLHVKRATVRLDWPAMMIISLLLWWFVSDNELSAVEGIILFLYLIGYSIYILKLSGNNNIDIDEIDEDDLKKPLYWHTIFVILGAVGLTYGADLLLNNAVKIAKYFGVSEYVIGTTIVAFGTSVPELITSVVAALKKQTDISIGNLIGSNMFNIGSVLGITAMVKKIPFEKSVVNGDIYWMIGVSLLIFPLMYTRNRISRLGGVVLLLFYTAYIYYVL